MLLLPFSNLLNVKAEGTTIDVDTSNKVTNMINLVSSYRDQLTAYKVLDVYYDKNTNEMSYKFTSAFQEFLSNSTDNNVKNLTMDEYISYGYDYNDSTLTADEKAAKDKAIRNLADSFARYIRSNDKTFQTYDLIENIETKVDVGSYLVLPKSINQYTIDGFLSIKSYSATIVNVMFEVINGYWYLNESINVSVKNDSMTVISSFTDGSPDKALESLFGEENNTPTTDMMFRKNKIYTYIYEMLNFVSSSTITITLPDGLKFVPGEIKYLSNRREDSLKLSEIKDKLIDEETGIEYATTAVSENRITITTTASAYDETFVPLLLVGVTLDDNSENIVLGESGNVIKADYDVVVDPYTPEPTKETLNLENKVTTYGLQITNKDANSSSTLLSNSLFGIYTDEACSDENLVGTLTTDSNGIVKFKGIINETYYIKQIKAATGYKLNTNPVKITVDTASLNIDNYFPLEATSEKAGLLPSTGGLGTVFYTLIGLTVIGIGAYKVIKYSKRQVNG